MTAPIEKSALSGRRVAITGRMASLRREDAIALIERLGGRYDPIPEALTDYVVVGEVGWPLKGDGRLTHHLEAAHRLRAEGSAVTILSETQFLTLMGERVVGNLERLFTAQQLARILRVTNRTVANWVRQGLIRPAKIVNNLRYFDFRQVASARALLRLLGAGVAPGRIRQSLDTALGWWPPAKDTLAQLEVMGDGGLALRLEDGTMAEPSGQLVLSFEDEADAAETRGEGESRPLAALASGAFGLGQAEPRSPDAWTHAARQFAATDRPALAVRAYQEALLAGGPDPEITFPLGNCLYRMGRTAESAQRFLQTIELSPKHVAAWNNLGNALGDMGQLGEAVPAFQRALLIQPDYADAHYNLAETLYILKDLPGARRHWLRYLQLDPGSPWAEHVRERLLATGSGPRSRPSSRPDGGDS